MTGICLVAKENQGVSKRGNSIHWKSQKPWTNAETMQTKIKLPLITRLFILS